MRLSSGLALAVTLSSLSLLATTPACSSDPDPTPSADGGADGATTPDEEGGTAAQCASSASYIECRLCCNEPPSYRASQNAFNDCMCESCKDLCATTACSTDADAGDASSECAACLQDDAKGQACFPKAEEACSKAPDCVVYRDCLRGADCNAKPDF
ncbi:MAG: hypothetical protein KIT84_07245 [Labilithrix sp.]|nr:hypothetical protein [Labilithrix sp.]MCW5810790.1 hypothetical protein [Labilithrix sp.]